MKDELKRSHKQPRSYPEEVNYLLNKFASDQAIAEYVATFLRYVQAAHLTPKQYAKDMIEKSCKAADVCGEDTVNDVSSEGVDQWIRHSIQIHWAIKSQADLAVMAFKKELLLVTEKRSGQQINVNWLLRASSRPYYNKSWAKRSTTNSASTTTLKLQSRSTRRRSKSPSVTRVQYPRQSS